LKALEKHWPLSLVYIFPQSPSIWALSHLENLFLNDLLVCAWASFRNSLLQCMVSIINLPLQLIIFDLKMRKLFERRKVPEVS
jgi:hypothetical protein